jgi:hypothetical protein
MPIPGGLAGGTGKKLPPKAHPDELTATNGPMDAFPSVEIRPGPNLLRPFSANFAGNFPASKQAAIAHFPSN